MSQSQVFFNDAHHFEHLRHRLLPKLIDFARDGHRIRIWSADCGTGEEPYAIAMTILDLAPDASSLNIGILATDKRSLALDYARAGSYDAKAVAQVPALFKARWMERRAGTLGPTYTVDESLRRLISFDALDLEKPFLMKCYFNAIFCRHGFEDLGLAARARIWARMMPYLAPGGVLYTGAEDRITGPALRQLCMAGSSTYMRSAA